MAEAATRSGRCILHVDMDAFFVAVEMLRHPELRGRPVVVGGAGPRGVVAAASYEARRYGVHSALASTIARRRCPEAVFLAGDYLHYADVSRQVFALFEAVTPFVEGLSLDEAFLDVTGARRHRHGEELAWALRERVATEVGLACSVGVAPNKFLAKLASEAAKPTASPTGVTPGRGVVVVRPGTELAFLHPLPVQSLWGVGPATLERLRRLGVVSVADLAGLSESVLVGALGKANGRHLHALSHGQDDRPVEPDRGVKSVSQETTFASDLHDREDLWREVVRLSDAVAARLRHLGLGARTLTLKVRFASFTTITRSVTPGAAVQTGPAIAQAVSGLLDTVDPAPGVRLIGVGAANLGEPAEQLGLFDEASARGGAWTDASCAVDGIRERFGDAAIGPASILRDGAMRPRRRGEQQWGPTGPDGSGPDEPIGNDP
jgi:DNA polymerase IV